MKLMNGFYVKMMNKVEEMKKDESGSQTLEWIGIAAVIVILVGVVSTQMADADSIGEAVVGAFEGLIGDITGD
ncbi:hypothetical protein KFZ58_03515 [Virgibacillus sp. NKC19-16]|uniref:Flp family type IVb pilin n=1 Tax=Virgibacillus salidurans TaxID=2831673 RepID=UPI001F3C008C|nr:hypothetical protein [Virgibacillus sp. NKC19-16]UJL47025.1 hypothetical protein KFZ58_03515 [Virgibacillus sp. NKC19-16]